MAVSRRTLFKGLFGAAGVAGLTILARQVDRAPKLLLRSDNDAEYDAWLKGDRKHYWQGTGPMEQLSAKTSGLRADYRTYLLSRTDIGCQVLYCEMLGIPATMWSGLSFENGQIKPSRREFNESLKNIEFPPIEEMMTGRVKASNSANYSERLPYPEVGLPYGADTGNYYSKPDYEVNYRLFTRSAARNFEYGSNNERVRALVAQSSDQYDVEKRIYVPLSAV